jgi:hypothetical protein
MLAEKGNTLNFPVQFDEKQPGMASFSKKSWLIPKNNNLSITINSLKYENTNYSLRCQTVKPEA